MINIRKKARRDGTYSLYLDIHFNNHRKRETLKGLILTGNSNNDRTVMQTAEAIRSQRSLEITRAEYNIQGVYAREDLFLPFYEKEGESRGMFKRHNIKRIINTISPGLRFKDINERWAEKFIAYMRKPVYKRTGREARPYSEATIYSSIGSIKTILNIAVKRGIIPANPLMGLELKRYKVQKTFLLFEEVARLSETACSYPEIKRAFLFACFTGLRLGDLEKLRYTNIEADSIRIIQGKTKTTVVIPLTDTIRMLLNSEALNHSGLVFNLPSRTTLNAALKTWVAAAGIVKSVSFHTARHTFATMLVFYSRDIFTASKLLGHSDVKVTQVYAKLVDDSLGRTMDTLPSLVKKPS